MSNYNFPIDLHCHTTRSDGADTPYEFLTAAAEKGMAVVAITDHDVRPPKTITTPDGEVDTLELAAQLGIKVIPGTEVSCNTQIEDVHVVCFGCNWDDPFWPEMEARVVRSKVESYRKLVDALNANGMTMTWEEVLENGGKPVPEEQVQKKMIFELIGRKGYTETWREAKMMVQKTPEYQILREKPDPKEIIAAAHATGGIAILAHPWLIRPTGPSGDVTADRYAYIEELIEAGLDGIEACYPYNKTSYPGSETPAEIEALVREKYTHRLQIISGGSDYHNDGKKGVTDPRQIGEGGITVEYFQSNPILSKLVD